MAHLGGRFSIGAPMPDATTLVCSSCSTPSTRDNAKLPRGWKRIGKGTDERIWCGECWHRAYVLRAISVPVVRPLGEGVGWPELRAALKEAFAASTALANYASTASYAAEQPREPGQKKIGKAPTPYLYPAAREKFPALPSQSVAGQLQRAQRGYACQRYDVVWTCAASLRSYRYPQPYSVPNQSWRASYEPAGKEGGDKIPCVSVPLPGGRFLLQLRGGREFARQLRDFALIVSGEAVQGEIAIIEQRSHSSHRNGTAGRDSGGQRKTNRVMAKMVAWFPRRPATEKSGTLFARTDADAFLIALDLRGERIWSVNADHVRRWSAEHARRLQRWGDDAKAELRPDVPFASRREAAAMKHRDRIHSFVRESAAQLVGFAARRKYATIRLDDSDHSYLPRFDWSGFRARLATKCDEAGVSLELASGEVVAKALGDARELDIV